jgi:hypothetical protein
LEQFSGPQAAFGTIFGATGGFWNNFRGNRRLLEQFSGPLAAFGTIFGATGGFWNNFRGNWRLLGTSLIFTGVLRNEKFLI